MPDWPDNNKPPTINNQSHLSQFNIQNQGNNPTINYNPLNNIQPQFPQQQGQPQQQPQQQQFQAPFSPAVNGLKRQREASDGLSPKNVSSPRARNVPLAQQQPQMQNMMFQNQPNIQPQGQQSFGGTQIRPQPQPGQQQLSQQFAANFANLPPHIQQRFAQQNPGQMQQMQLAQQHQQQQQQQQQQPQPQGQQRPNTTQQSPTYPIQPAPNRFVQPQPGQLPQGGQFDPSRQQFGQNQPAANQMQPPLNQNPQLYQQQLLRQQQQHQQQLAQAGSPPNAQAGLPQQFQNQAQHPGINQLSTQPMPESQRSPAMRNMQAPKSTNSPHQAPRQLPPTTPQQQPHPLQSQPQHPQTPQQIAPGQSPAGQSRPPGSGSKESFMNSLYDFMGRRGTHIQSTPFINSRQIDLFVLYLSVMKEGGFQAATNKGAWGRVAASNALPTGDPSVANQLAELYKVYLLPFEEALQKAQAARRQNALTQGRPAGQSQQPIQPQMQPAPHTPQQAPQPPPILPNQTPQQTPIHPAPQQMHPHQMQPLPNGMLPQQMHPVSQQHQTPNILPNHMQRMPPQQTPQTQRPIFQTPQPPQHGPVPGKVPIPAASPVRKASLEPTPQPQSRQPSVSKVLPRKPQYQPKKRNIETYGGWHIQDLIRFGQGVDQLRPTVPQMTDLGAVDIHALTMSLRSGLPGELCNALDILTVLSNDTRTVLSLIDCWDLLDVLVDVAADDCDVLEEGLRVKRKRISCAPMKDKKALVEFEHYHDLVQSCQGFSEDLEELVEGCEKDSAQLKLSADRLLCVTALLRNFSFVEFNHEIMGGEEIVRFICRLLRGLRSSTARPFLVTRRNNVELVRDLITLLSNVAHYIRLPDIECAQLIFSFVLSFAPEDHPTLNPEVLIFSPFKPGRDAYLPPALDTLAKLLVVDHPNKEYFTTLLRATTDKPEGGKFSRGDILLTKAFGMAISILPTNEPAQAFFTKEERMALAEQGMLAATALVEMLPQDGDLARFWLSAKDNFGARLVRTVFHLAAIHEQRLLIGVPASGGPYSHITRRGMKIVEVMTSRAAKGLKEGDMVAVACSKKEQLLGAMLTGNMDGAIVESLWRLHDIEDSAGVGGSPRAAESPKVSR
jgi:SWI/SNF chromatin-remodeling complex subunit SWI1